MNLLGTLSDPRRFGRRQPFVMEAVAAPSPALSDDMKLFLMTYLGGFLIVSIFLA
ncbi:hypothetical protein [Sphingomonas alba]|uniref:Uncharacterized protein n=1 Tax=Sphingomonas alba TaxID=2908208 RepID=A0ABT0RQ03_9SPHN|nr:hypothetical protein [Sphingomonas alba]MCL6684570.1 hypothetical protein [Sphingomonas alba]